MYRRRVLFLSSTVMTPLILFLLFQSSIGGYDSHRSIEDINGYDDGEEEEDITASVYGSTKSSMSSPIGLERFLFPTAIQYTRLMETIALDKRSPTSPKCSSDLLIIADGIRKRKPFAFKFLDSSAKNPSGILEGQTSDLGNYDECINIQYQKGNLNGKYCLIHIHSKMMDRKLNFFKHQHESGTKVDDEEEGEKEDINVTFDSKMNILEKIISSGMESNRVSSLNYGICIPSICEPSHIETSLNKQFRDLNWRLSIDCDEKGSVTESAIDILTIGSNSIIVILVTLVVIATWHDLKPDKTDVNLTSTSDNSRTENEKDRIGEADRRRGSANKSSIIVHGSNNSLSNMSIIRNSSKLFSDYEDTVNKTLSFVHGARVWFTLALTWINLWVYSSVFIPTPNASFKPGYTKDLSDVIHSSTVGFNDMMFTMSGILVLYTWLPQLERSSRTNFPSRKATFVRYFITRWLRTTPTVLGALLLTFGLNAIGSGPYFNLGSSIISENCGQNWWAALIQVSNWIEPDKTCLPFNWYLSVDFQLYLIAFLILWLISVKPTGGIIATILLMIIGLLAPGISSYLLEIDSFNPIPGMPYQGIVGHFSTVNYISCYLAGIIVGYCLLKGKRLANERSWIVGWITIVSFFTLINLTSPSHLYSLFSLFSDEVTSKRYSSSSLDYSPFSLSTEEIVLFTLKKLSTLSLVSWSCFALANSRAPFLDLFLSPKFFTPLSRMAFSIYSSQFAVIAFDSLVRRTASSVTIYEAVSRTISVWIISIALGYLIYMTLEAPSVNMIKSALVKLSPNESVSGKIRPLKGQRKQRVPFNNNNNETKSGGILILQSKYK